MADKGFTTQNEPARLNVGLNILSFLGERAQLTEVEVKGSQTLNQILKAFSAFLSICIHFIIF